MKIMLFYLWLLDTQSEIPEKKGIFILLQVLITGIAYYPMASNC